MREPHGKWPLADGAQICVDFGSMLERQNDPCAYPVQIWLYAYAPHCRRHASPGPSLPTLACPEPVPLIRSPVTLFCAGLHKPTTCLLHGLACQNALAQFQHIRAPNTAAVLTAPSCTALRRCCCHLLSSRHTLATVPVVRQGALAVYVTDCDLIHLSVLGHA
jgi:hypothetical protein